MSHIQKKFLFFVTAAFVVFFLVFAVGTLETHPEIADSATQFSEIEKEHVYQLILVLVYLVTVTIFIYIFFIKRFTQRINLIKNVLEEFEHGIYGRTVPEKGDDELSYIIRHLNALSGSLVARERGQKKLDKVLSRRAHELEDSNKVLQDTKIAIMNILEDLDEENRISQHTLQELEKFKLAIENINEGIIITDVNASIQYMNEGLERITGYLYEECRDKDPADLWGGQMPREYYEHMWDLLLRKQVFQGELRNKRKNGELFDAEIIISPIFNDRGETTFYVGIQRDITEQKRTDRAKSEFISIASHQLRTPLTGMQWYMEMLLDRELGDLTPEQLDYLTQAYTSTRRLTRLINDLLNLSRLETGRLSLAAKLVDIEKLTASAVQEMHSFAEARNAELIFTPLGNLKKIKTDPDLVREVIINLISNALKYNKNKKPKVTITISEADGSYVVAVKDNGIGISKEDQSQLFAKFFRSGEAVSMETGGSGLGLYINKLILTELDGKIWVESEKGKGSTFSISLPKKGIQSKQRDRQFEKVKKEDLT